MSLFKLLFIFPLSLLLYLPASFPPAQARAETYIEVLPQSFAPDQWRVLAPGLDMLELNLQKSFAAEGQPAMRINVAPRSGQKQQGNFVIVRSDPEKCAYSLHMASEDGIRGTLPERMQKHKLYAAINAGMFLPDNLKNTGFMRNATHVNNGRIAENLGAFFLAGPRNKALPKALILEKADLGDMLTDKIASYDIVIQNFRLINGAGKLLWPESREANSISALSADRNGNILFIFSEIPLSAADFARVLLTLPLGTGLTMYLE
ncbi:MAG: phosphodiester glycosidase family protein, partial [Desulfovibrio sp.]|nr:phosphodiester glycosidase family protein [Desulfovibrio sp.]